MFVNGNLVPNTEFGHLYLAGHDDDVETWTAAKVRQRDDLEWTEWVARAQQYLQHLERIISPDLFILGGGISKKFDEWGPLLTIDTEILPAHMRNDAGIVGAAMATVGWRAADSGMN